MTRRIAMPAVVVALAFVLASCGSGHSSSDHGSDDHSSATDGASATLSSNGFGTADLEFAQSMIVHHEQAIEMAEIALDPKSAASPDVVDLATRIQAAQTPEIELMTGWLTEAGAPTSAEDDEHHMSMDGMMTTEQMGALAAQTGAEFDTAWLEMMIDHHEGAISQATAVAGTSANADVLALAGQIVADQEAEISEMQALLPN